MAADIDFPGKLLTKVEPRTALGVRCAAAHRTRETPRRPRRENRPRVELLTRVLMVHRARRTLQVDILPALKTGDSAGSGLCFRHRPLLRQVPASLQRRAEPLRVGRG